MNNIKELSIEQLQELYEELKKQYDAEDKPLYKRHIGGKMLTVLKEIKLRR